MQGSLRQRGEGSWQLRVHAGRDVLTGKKLHQSKTFHGTKREAQRALAEMITDLERTAPKVGKEGTLELLLNEWLEHAEINFSPKTGAVVRGYIDRTIVPAIGNLSVAKLGPSDLDAFYRQLIKTGGPKGPFKPATVRRIHTILRSALGQGVKWGWIRHNPAVDASPPRVLKPEITPPTPDQVAAIFHMAREESPAFAAYVVLAASSGARRSELVALRWENIDFTTGRLVIRRGIVGNKSGLIEKDTKTHQARKLKLDATTLDILTEHRQACEKNAEECGVEIPASAFVFSIHADGSHPWWPDSVTRMFRIVADKAGVKGVRLHDLRHYVASRLLTEGVDVRTVAGRLGHRNASTTLDVYSHFIPESDDDAADALGRLFDEAVERAAVNE